MSDLVKRLRDLSACKHDDLSIGNEAADRIETLERELAEAQQRIFDLEQAATDPEYAKKNPLDGPARMFDVIAGRIRAGEDYNEVLADYGLDAEAQRDAERYRFLRGKSMLGGNQFYSRIMEIHDEEIDKARGA